MHTGTREVMLSLGLQSVFHVLNDLRLLETCFLVFQKEVNCMELISRIKSNMQFSDMLGKSCCCYHHAPHGLDNLDVLSSLYSASCLLC